MGYFACSQNTDAIVKVEFSSLTRGYQELVIITKDSVSQSVNGRGESSENAIAIKAIEWDCIIKAFKKVSLQSIPELQSPTMKRSYDGALHSTITITTASGQQFIHSFDDDEPHEKLKPLMREINLLRKKLKS
jgi:hypothetical protein